MDTSKPKASTLTDEQRKRIEENRQKAIQRRKELLSLRGLNQNIETPSTSGSGTSKPNDDPFEMFWDECWETCPSSTDDKKSEKLDNPDKEKTVNIFPPFQTQQIVYGTCSMIERKRFKVQMSYHGPTIEMFKTIPSRSYDMNTKTWSFEIEDHNSLITKLKPLKSSVSVSPLPSYVLKTFLKAGPAKVIKEVDVSSLGEKLKESLLPFQLEGVYFGINKNGRVLIADDMGLGKTIQALAIAHYYVNEWPLLIICPSSVRYSWQEAFFMWLPSVNRSHINLINNTKQSIGWGEVIILSYDMAARKKAEMEQRKFQVAIIDESHFMKNQKSARTKAIQNSLKKSKRIMLLSGTPALSRPMELYTQLSIIQPNLFFGFHEFGIRYCGGSQKPWGWDFTKSSNMTELNLLLEETVMIRRLKAEVMTQLPAKRRQVIMLDPSSIKLPSTKDRNFVQELAKKNMKSMEKRGVLLEFYHHSSSLKLKAVCNYIQDLLEADNKFICFAHHQVMLDGIEQLLKEKKIGYMRIDGTTQSEKRKINCDRFQLVESCRVAVLSITAANAGINLTAASLVVFAELFWNPGILTQAEDRAHRIGQQDCVMVQYLVAEGTADDVLWPMVQKKLDVLSKAGLSKDNFQNSDTISMATESYLNEQLTLDSFWLDIDIAEEQVEPPKKRIAV